ncbi:MULTISPECIES: hypothetical protein [unclassified Pseudomonas]|uniref:hypothetical protein n=1 Tax=unclassified Pseudomonas TaxID=196821 RepID=UPI000A1E0A40|nr:MULTISPECIES: hypothetical protein [unclassified Pseudomonas]
MQSIWDLMTNAHMEAWVWGPLMGAIVAMMFAGFSGPLKDGTPLTVNQTTNVFVTNNIVIKNNGNISARDNGGAGAILFALAIATLYLAWKYVVYSEHIHYTLNIFITSVLAFSITTAITSAIKGQFTSSSWILYILTPIVALGLNYSFLAIAANALDPALPALARETTAADFYLNRLSEYWRAVVLYQMLGIALIFFTTLCSAIVLIHYLALMNQRSSGAAQPFWIWVTRTTLFVSGKGWLVIMTAFIAMTYVLVEPSCLPAWTTSP